MFMVSNELAHRFEEVLRTHLPLLSADAVLEQDTPLTDLGLDSLGTVALLIELEETFDIAVPDDKLSVATFATARALWSTVVECGTEI